MTTTVKELIEQLSKANPDEYVYAHWFLKADIAHEVDDLEVEKNKSTDFFSSNDFTDEMFKSVIDLIHNDDLVNEAFGNAFTDYLRDVVIDTLNEQSNDDTELWEN